jgi:dipeptidyl aminopeptidase/acylaminoacyl peptidase
MEAVREVTKWEVDYRQPNHDYLLDGDKILAYRPWGTAEIRVLKGKVKLDRRGRKFVKLDENPFKNFEQPQTQPLIIEVKGSKGQTYYVNKEEGRCTCQGFQFRGRCKHVEQV